MLQSLDQGATASTPSPSDSRSTSLTSKPNPRPEPHYESLRHMVFGSKVAVQNTIKLLHRLNYAEPNEWSKLIPTEKANEVMAVLTKKIRTR